MTAAATIFALVPMALGITGNGGFIAQPLAVVVIGGLVSSTLLTLVIVPVLYRMAEGPGERRRLREEARTAERRNGRSRREEAERREAEGDAPVDHLAESEAVGTAGAVPSGAVPSGTSPASTGSGSGRRATPTAQRRDLAQRRPDLGAGGTTGTAGSGAVSSGTAGSGGAGQARRRRSLKERGGIVGIVKRRLGRG
jgi:HAE1 family hydrophobic/amphiphilic exporter-1